MAGRNVLEAAERKFLTILFADIRNSTRIIQLLDPEDAMAKLRPAIELMTLTVREAGGMVNRIQGDGIMALFGAPIAVEDHALRACRAALLMRDRFAELPDREISIRIGINSGEVVAHIDAGDFASTYDVTGPAAHLAARLEQLADSSRILISDSTHALVRGAVEAKKRPGVMFRGFDQPIDIWELNGLAQRSRWADRRQSGLSRFVGRSVELEELRRRLLQAVGGSTQLLMIGGDPGIGKSRLLHELLGVARSLEAPCTIWDAHAEATTNRAPFATLRQLLRQWLGVDEAALPEDVLEALRSRLATSNLPVGAEAALCAVLNIASDERAWREMDLHARRRLIERSVLALIESAQHEQPLILVVDDFHWADTESRELLVSIITERPAGRVSIIVTHRPMEGIPADDEHVSRITLAEFSYPVAEELLEILLGGDPSVWALKRRLLEWTGRLPLFLEETVRHLLETGALSGVLGDCRAAGDGSEIAAPRSVQAVAAARIDALAGPVRTLVRTASPLGRRFPRALLADVAAVEPAFLTDALQELARRHILFDNPDGIDGFVEFRHELIREAAYGALIREDRYRLHRSAVDAIERRYADQLRNWSGIVAYHAAQAQLWEKAADYEQMTADSAIDTSSYSAALASCQRALEYIGKAPRTLSSIKRGIDVRLMLRGAIAPTSDFATWLKFADEALSEARVCGDQARIISASLHRAWALNFAGEPKDAVPAAETARASAQLAQDDAASAAASFVLGQARYAAGSYVDALAALDGAAAWYVGEREFARSGGSATTSVSCHMMRATCLGSLGRFDRAGEASGRADEIAARTARPYDRALAFYGRGVTSMLEGKPVEAVLSLERSRELCLEAGLPTFQLLVETHLGAAYVASGRKEESRSMLESALAAASRLNHVVAFVAGSIFRGGLTLVEGDATLALQHLMDAREVARSRGFRGLEVTAGRLIGVACLALGKSQYARAVSELTQAAALARACGALPQQARCLLTLADAGRQAADGASWRLQAAQARDLFTQMGLQPEAARAQELSHV
ncbi:ATP-binding protein [Reyranella sp.]|uniref:ATP-binding protein n=1 Tax=Reyranella sp. TaxID=1929291 RepID=UPI003BAB532B